MARRRETRSEHDGGPVWAPPWWAPVLVFGTIALAALIARALAG